MGFSLARRATWPTALVLAVLAALLAFAPAVSGATASDDDGQDLAVLATPTNKGGTRESIDAPDRAPQAASRLRPVLTDVGRAQHMSLSLIESHARGPPWS